MMTFMFDLDDLWAEKKLTYVKGAKNPVICFVPKILHTCIELLAFLRLKHFKPVNDLTELQQIYITWYKAMEKQGKDA
jgi:hypothetical protein